MRQAAAGMKRAAAQFRRVKGCRQMPALITVLGRPPGRSAPTCPPDECALRKLTQDRRRGSMRSGTTSHRSSKVVGMGLGSDLTLLMIDAGAGRQVRPVLPYALSVAELVDL